MTQERMQTPALQESTVNIDEKFNAQQQVEQTEKNQELQVLSDEIDQLQALLAQ